MVDKVWFKEWVRPISNLAPLAPLAPLPPFFQMAQNLDLRCVLLSDPSTTKGAGSKTRLESSKPYAGKTKCSGSRLHLCQNRSAGGTGKLCCVQACAGYKRNTFFNLLYKNSVLLTCDVCVCAMDVTREKKKKRIRLTRCAVLYLSVFPCTHRNIEGTTSF